MQISDRVYGSVIITEPLLVELIESPALQRLKGVDVAGYLEPWKPGSKRDRFEHSVGVMWALHEVGAKEKNRPQDSSMTYPTARFRIVWITYCLKMARQIGTSRIMQWIHFCASVPISLQF